MFSRIKRIVTLIQCKLILDLIPEGFKFYTEPAMQIKISAGEDSDRPEMPFPVGTQQIVTQAQRYFLYTTAVSFLALLVWAAYTNIDRVTRGTGQVEPSLQNQMVQHLEGGIVEEILVHEGQTVKAGDVLMRVKDSFSKAEYLKASQNLLARQVELGRLTAESQAAQTLEYSNILRKKAPKIVEDEEQLFKRRIKSLEEQKLILADQHKRKSLEKKEKQSRLINTKKEYDLVAERVENLKKLFKSGATSKNELLQNQSNLQKIKTRLSDLKHQIPQIETELSELERRKTDLTLNFQSEADAQRIEILRKTQQLEQTLAAMQDRNKRTEVRAPIDGKVHRLFQTTVGGVVRGGQNLAQLVPLDAPISISIKLSPKDRGKVWIDLPAVVKLSAYDYSIYGGLPAKVTDISSDVLQDEKNEPYFRVKLEADTENFGKDRPIVAGMSAEVDIITGKQTILDYILKPIRRVSEKALREG